MWTSVLTWLKYAVAVVAALFSKADEWAEDYCEGCAEITCDECPWSDPVDWIDETDDLINGEDGNEGGK